MTELVFINQVFIFASFVSLKRGTSVTVKSAW